MSYGFCAAARTKVIRGQVVVAANRPRYVIEFINFAMLHYDTNPNLFSKFFYLLWFSRSDLYTFFSPDHGKKTKQKKTKKKKHAPQKKFGKFSETRQNKV
jgi:hypothetical protein